MDVSTVTVKMTINTDLGLARLASTLVPGVGTSSTESLVSFERTLVVGDFAGGLGHICIGEGGNGADGSSFEVFGLQKVQKTYHDGN